MLFFIYLYIKSYIRGVGDFIFRDGKTVSRGGVLKNLGGGGVPEIARAVAVFIGELLKVAPISRSVKIDGMNTEGKEFELTVIGERINPTGKKRFKQALVENDIDYILNEGLAQQEKGVHVLDVNVGLPDINEVDMITEAVCELQAIIDLPLQIDTTNILFICGGAFDGLDKIVEKRTDKSAIGFDAPVESKKKRDVGKLLAQAEPRDLLKFGIIPELVGRVPVIATLESLTQKDLVRILVEPKNALTKQYQTLLGMDGVVLEISDEALLMIAQKALDRQIGARGLRAVMEKVMTGIMFHIPSDLTIRKVVITAGSVEGAEPTIIRDEQNPRPQLGA